MSKDHVSENYESLKMKCQYNTIWDIWTTSSFDKDGLAHLKTNK